MLLAAAGAVIVGNLYYGQPLAGIIGPALGLSPAAAGLVVTLPQLGYGLGLLLIVPLGDLVENRRLILLLTGCAAIALFGAALSNTAGPFLAASLGIGLSSVVLQVLVPYASHLASDAKRGRIVGLMMSGQMLGVMLARPLASLVTFYVSWHAVFALSAACLSVLLVVLARALPRRVPRATMGYGRLLVSMSYLARGTPVLQRKALYQAALFSSFTLFWTTAPLLLAGPDYGMSQFGIAWFALVGAAAVITAPVAGRVADRGWTRAATGVSIGVVAACFPLTRLAHPGSTVACILLAAAGLFIGMGMTANVVLGQRAIFLLRAEHRSRLNGLYIAASYLSGAVGSAAGGLAYARGGWPLASWIGLALPLAALICFATEFRTTRRQREPSPAILERRSLP